MLGILRTSGTNKSVEHLTDLLKEKKFDMDDTKSILLAIYEISDREKIKRKVRKDFEKYLIENRLDTLSRYDLFSR
jgi:SOS response regulatory protein OraA/RecX